MTITFQKFSCELQELIQFLCSETWYYHGKQNPTKEEITKQFDSNVFSSKDNETFWIVNGNNKIGLLRIFDLQDAIPLFDLRIKEAFRSAQVGEKAVNWLTNYLFQTYPNVLRIEGHTRHDNLAMRKVFHKCGYMKEAHLRKAWIQEDKLYDAVTYGIIKEDWESGRTTAVNWDDIHF
jgi:RimJ/RimL family protein N-acetyltransferase